MPRVRIELPTLLGSVLGGQRELTVEGDTLRGALENAFEQVPALRVHLFEESGKLRPHVLCFLNEVNTRWLEQGDQPLSEGDCITILQAVSGG